MEDDAAQIARTLDDVDVAGINTNYATQAGLDPTKDAILREGSEGTVYQHDRGARRGQGQAMGKDAGEELPVAGNSPIVLTKFKGTVLQYW